MKEARRIHSVNTDSVNTDPVNTDSLHLHKVQEQSKVIYNGRNQKSGCHWDSNGLKWDTQKLWR